MKNIPEIKTYTSHSPTRPTRRRYRREMVFFVAAMLLASFLFMTITPSCKKTRGADDGHDVAQFSCYRDIPGVTADEIAAIEAVKAERDSFRYAVNFSSEAFHGADGVVRGFTALFCEYLTGLFGIRFKPTTVEWDELIAGLADGSIDFTGELTPKEERRSTYFMTDAIAVRSVNYFRIRGSTPLEQIAAETGRVRLAFLEGSVTLNDVSAVSEMAFESVFVPDYEAAYGMLARGEADAFLDENTAIAAFDLFGDVVAKDFLPLTYSFVAFTAQNPRLAPFVSVVQKALHNGIRGQLIEMYCRGEREFVRQRFERTLTDEEREYLRDRSTVRFAAEFDNYPVSFYNNHEKQWQGVAFDALHEIEKLSGLSFEVVNATNATFSELFEMLRDGRAEVVSELIRTPSREGHFLWPSTALMQDRFALVSKLSTPRITINQILDMRVGLFKGTAHTELFKTWFPGHTSVVEYSTTVKAFQALDRGEVDLVMASENHLLMITHYMEYPNYKINILFDRAYESFLGINKNEVLLHSIVDKALKQIDLARIASDWRHRTYDYRAKIAEMRQPWFISVFVLLFCVIILLFVLYIRERDKDKRVERKVSERTTELRKRTTELDEQRKLLEHLSMVDQLTGIPNRRCFDTQLDRDWRTAARNQTVLSVLVMDIDRFKQYNDTYGHPQGDVALRETAKVITQTIKRPADFAARWGGEEFVVILPDTNLSGAMKVAEDIRAAVEALEIPLADGSMTKITISIGVNSQKPTQKSKMNALISGADDALYIAKELGRNRVHG